MTSRTATLLSFCILGCVGVTYSAALYVVYTARSEQSVVLTPEVSSESQARTKRVQAKIGELYLAQDDAAKIFDILDEVAKTYSVAAEVETITNPQVASKGKLVPVSFIDAKINLSGPIQDTLRALADLETLPILTRVTDIEVAEDRDAQQPKVTATVRFYVRNT